MVGRNKPHKLDQLLTIQINELKQSKTATSTLGQGLVSNQSPSTTQSRMRWPKGILRDCDREDQSATTAAAENEQNEEQTEKRRRSEVE